ncbi:MurR/RpiR family transcriptional regulator [Chromohalobacter beijerinckii]|uniref:MurR/RpiR family transcriptional regulator n=1 Tax=Chromohalobacter beijerinckii TaxID=86179 RepID=A0ABV8X8R8_9GAMM|nr:MurR/RpiR family transcriptional regulator [Chromohalobacter beijerinckii]MCK0766785.1 MurR/RpiR family transcriptional regulator [Chromohalobacter beijerinckii]
MNQTPNDFEELERRVTEDYPSLSRRLQQTARFVLDNPQEVAFSTVAKLAGQAGVTPSTLIRFSNSFGFTGFSEMQKLFRERLVNELPNYAERIRAVRNATGSMPNSTQLLWEFSEANRDILEVLPSRINPDSLELALDILENAEIVHVLGVRRSFVVASYFSYAMQHINKRTFLIDGLGGMHLEQVRSVGKNDALLVVSYSPYAPEAQEASAHAKELGIPLIVMTDSNLSPLARLADVTIIFQEAEVKSFRSLTASLCLAQTIAISLGIRKDNTDNYQNRHLSSPKKQS